jgi:hypothetical protein
LNELLGAAEVSKLQHMCAWIKENILWLQIAMHDPQLVQEQQSTRQLVHVDLHESQLDPHIAP